MSEKRFEFPGFIDVHVHFRDPGVPEAETTASGLEAARRGGFAAVVVMPNTTPPIDTPERVRAQYSLGANASSQNSSTFNLQPSTCLLTSACITKGREGKEVAELEALAEAGAVFFTDDGTYVEDQQVLEEAMRRAYDLNMVVSQHALSPRFSEAEAIARDLAVCRETGCRYHVQHISTAKGVELVRAAQREGLPVTAEATPHHLLLTCDDIPCGSDEVRVMSEEVRTSNSSLLTIPSSFFKMAPPLATKEDRAEVRKAVKEGVLMFATDHAPHPFAKKNVPYAEAANGIIGLETAIPITYHVMVEEEGMSVEDWARAWWEMPRSVISNFKSQISKSLIDRNDANQTLNDFKTVVEVGEEREIDVNAFASLSRNCPYHGMKFRAFPATLSLA